MTALVVQLEVSPRAVDLDRHGEVGEMQILRGLHKPLLADPASPDYAIVEIDDLDEAAGRARLRVRDDAVWHDGTPVTPDEIREGIVRGAARHAGFAQLIGLRLDTVRRDTRRRLVLGVRRWDRIAHGVLSQISFAPRRRRGAEIGYSGILRPAPGGGFTAEAGGRTTPVRFHVESAREHALRAFRRGEISVTAPCAFDVADACAGDAHFRACEPDVHALLFVNPARCPALAPSAVRATLGAAVRRRDEARPAVLLPERGPPKVGRPGRLSGLRVRVWYGAYWPNGWIAARVAQSLLALGAEAAEPAPLALPALVERFRRGDFEVIMVLLCGVVSPRESLPITLGAMAMRGCPPAARQWIAACFDSAMACPRGSAEGAEALSQVYHHVPAVPLFRFRAGYLAQPAVPRVPLIGGMLFPLERLLASARGGAAAGLVAREVQT